MTPITPTLRTLTICVAALAILACVAGLLPGGGTRRSFTSISGAQIELQGAGLYRNDSVSFAAQAKAQDLVTLVLGVPLLVVSLALAARGSRRGGILLAGTFAYFTYTYTTYAFGVYYNSLFLVYIALFSMSVLGLILALKRMDAGDIKTNFSGKGARTAAIVFSLFTGGAVFLLWMARILPGLLGGPDATLIEHYTTLPVQVLDLGFVAPLAILSGVSLARNRPLGYLLAGLLLMKGATLTLALGAMILWMAFSGVPVNPAETVVFGVIIVAGVGTAAAYFRAVR